MVAAGRLHTVALREDGTVLAAGDDQFGQCQVGDWKDIVYIAAGKYHTLGVREDGTVVAAGDGQFGQCNVEDWTDIVAVAAGDSHTLGLRTDGTVVATGRDSSGKCSLGDWKGIVAVAAGMDHSWACARTAPWWPPGRGCSAPAPWPTGRISSPSPRGTSTPKSLRRDGRMVEADGFAAPGVTEWTDLAAIALSPFHTVGLKKATAPSSPRGHPVRPVPGGGLDGDLRRGRRGTAHRGAEGRWRGPGHRGQQRGPVRRGKLETLGGPVTSFYKTIPKSVLPWRTSPGQVFSWNAVAKPWEI